MRNEDRQRINEIVEMLKVLEANPDNISVEEIERIESKVALAHKKLTNRTVEVSGCNLQYTRANMESDEAYDILEIVMGSLSKLDPKDKELSAKIEDCIGDLSHFI